MPDPDWIDLVDDAQREATLSWLAHPRHHVLPQTDERFPELLRLTGQAPSLLYVDGDPDLLCMPQIAIVGSRNATPGGLEIARQFAAHLAKCGLTITSGLALGVDAAAHTGALSVKGRTIAVLGTGPDVDYPRGNAALGARISQSGARVSEFAPGTTARRGHFPQRNRIIAGMSLGTLVIEAGIQSGSLITARLAGDFGREVFAVPGSIHSPLSKGCHQLIRQGAKLVEKAADIMEEISEIARSLSNDMLLTVNDSVASAPLPDEDPDYAKLLSIMGFDPISVDSLVNRTGLTAEQLSSMLLILELQGTVQPVPGGRFQQMGQRKQSHE